MTDRDGPQERTSSHPLWVRLVALLAIVALLGFLVAQVL